MYHMKPLKLHLLPGALADVGLSASGSVPTLSATRPSGRKEAAIAMQREGERWCCADESDGQTCGLDRKTRVSVPSGAFAVRFGDRASGRGNAQTKSSALVADGRGDDLNGVLF